MKKIIIISSVVVFLGIFICLLFTNYQKLVSDRANKEIGSAFQKLFPNRAYREPGSRWVSTDPDIVYQVNPNGSINGEMKYKGKTIKIIVGTPENCVAFIADGSTGDTNLDRAIKDTGNCLFSTGIKFSSDTKVVFSVSGTVLPDFKYKQITFIRSK